MWLARKLSVNRSLYRVVCSRIKLSFTAVEPLPERTNTDK